VTLLDCLHDAVTQLVADTGAADLVGRGVGDVRDRAFVAQEDPLELERRRRHGRLRRRRRHRRLRRSEHDAQPIAERHPGLRSPEVAALTGLGRERVQALLRQAVAAGVVVKSAATRGTRYWPAGSHGR